LRNHIHFGITNKSRTSEQVSELPVESSRWLAASNSVKPPFNPYSGFAFGNKVS
jgi:hypothetical protein